VSRKDRITIQEKEREQQKLKDLEHEAKRLASERRQQTLKVMFQLLLLSLFAGHIPAPKSGWLCSLVAKALDLQLAGCEFNSRPWRCRVTTLGKLFTPTCLSRSRWFSDGMIDCGVRGRGQLCLSRQPQRCTALGTGCAPFLQFLGRLNLPPSM